MVANSTTRLFRPIRLAALLLSAATCSAIWADDVFLADGTHYEGQIARIGSLVAGPGRDPTPGENPLRNILLIDRGACRTFVPVRHVAEIQPSPQLAQLETFELRQPGSGGNTMVSNVGNFIEITPFDEFGRRTVSMQGARGRIDIIQGITEITPEYVRLAAIRHLWESAMATSSIPPDELHAILTNQLDPASSDDWLRLARFYIQAGMYAQAQEVLGSVLRQFPERGETVEQVSVGLRQLQARQVLDELRLRRDAGQHSLAIAALSQFTEQFPAEELAADVLQEIRTMLGEYEELDRRGAELLRLLEQTPAQLDDQSLEPEAEAAVAEIAANLNFDNLARLDAFRALSGDPQLSADEKLALAITGWLLGNANAETDLGLALRLRRARDIIVQYLTEPRGVQREHLILGLQNIEGVSAERVALLIENLTPWLTDTDPAGGRGEAQRAPAGGPAEAQRAPAGGEPPQGPLHLSAPLPGADREVEYALQLPPEYNPYRRYPVILALHAAGREPAWQIEGFWGEQAARHGYLVAAPEYAAADATSYDYGAASHAAVIAVLRDLLQRFQIDADRVFLAGHGMGADAAWDMGMSHPDLFAGVVPISGLADRYCAFYWRNARSLPFYVVGGELDRDLPVRNARDLERMMDHGFPVVYTEYIGRGHEHFYDEIHHIFDWMNRQRRAPEPAAFECNTMRASENRFYWIALAGLPDAVLRSEPGVRGARPMTVEGNVTPGNAVYVTGGAVHTTVWLSPRLVDFQERIRIYVNGQSRYSGFLRPSLTDMLEDVRVRGDRQRFYWARFEWPER